MVPLVRPVTTQVVAAVAGSTEVVVQVLAPGDEVTVYRVMVAPPLLIGAVQLTVDWARSPEVAVAPVGGAGTEAGTAAAEGADATLVPVALVAVTVNVYAVPLVKPVTVQEVAAAVGATDVVVQVLPPGDEVTVYLVMVAPPLEAGAVHETTDWELALDVAVTPVGAPGTAAGVAEFDTADAAPLPDPLVATTGKV